MILKRTSIAAVAGLLLTSALPASLHPSCGCSREACELHSQRYDSRLQAAADRALGGPAAAIVVVDVDSGRILAAKNLEFAGNGLIRSGSTLKPFVLMELLGSGKLNPRQRLVCRRPLGIAGMRLDCSHTPDVSQLDADEAIACSCNSSVAEIAPRMSGDQPAEPLRRRGLNSLARLVGSESTGYLERLTSQAQLQLMALAARGIEVAPLELLTADRKLAPMSRRGNTSTDEAVFLGLEQAVTYGTAHAASVDGMKIAAKTGTAFAADNPRTQGIFVGYAPADEPVVHIPQGRGGEAAMVAHSALEDYRQIKKKP